MGGRQPPHLPVPESPAGLVSCPFYRGGKRLREARPPMLLPAGVLGLECIQTQLAAAPCHTPTCYGLGCIDGCLVFLHCHTVFQSLHISPPLEVSGAPRTGGKITWDHHSLTCEQHSLPSAQFSHSFVSDSSRPHESQHARPPCPSPIPRVHSDSCPSSQ